MHAVVEAGELIGWIYTDANKKRGTLIPDQVIHLKNWNPYHDINGLSEWEAAMIAAESDYAAGTFARNLAKNNGDRGPFVIGKGGVFTDDQIKQVSAQLRQKRELGRRGEFRAAFLPADVDIKDPAVNAVDSAYVTQRLENRKEVYIAFGVPPSFADPQSSYSIGSASDRFRLIEDECMPLGAKIADAFEIISSRFRGLGETIFVEFDWDSHSTMQQVRVERFETATKAVDRGMPWQIAGEYFRLKLPRFAGDEVGRIPFNLTEIEKTQDGKTQDTREEEEAGDSVAELEQLFAKRLRTPCKVPAKVERSAKSQATWARVHRNREAWEKKFQAKIRRHLMDARGETLRRILADGTSNIERSTSNIEGKTLDVLSIIFDLDSWLKDWTRGLLGISRAAVEAAGMELWTEELRRDDPLTMPAQEVLEALSERENRIKGAGTKVWEDIKRELEAGINTGETTDQLAERVRRKFSAMDKGRAVTIAKTETTVIYEQGRDMVFRAAGVQWTEWVTSGIDASRHNTYPDLNGQRREMGEMFTVGLSELAFPGDPDGPADEVINCNCVRIAVAGPDDDGLDELGDDEGIPY